MLIECRQQRVYADYYQFYIEDASSPGDTADAAFWSEQAYDNRLAVTAGTIGIGTGSYGFVRVTTEIHDHRPAVQLEDWEHVTETGIDVARGPLRVKGCLGGNDAGEAFQLAAGHYRVRCCHANLAGSVEFGEGEDWYLLQIWPSARTAPRILKRAPPPE
jgi:hypothetical protein